MSAPLLSASRASPRRGLSLLQRRRDPQRGILAKRLLTAGNQQLFSYGGCRRPKIPCKS